MAATPLHRWSPDSPAPTVALRLAARDEAAVVRRLAALDDQPARFTAGSATSGSIVVLCNSPLP